MPQYHNKIKVSVLVKPITHKILKEMIKGSSYGMGVIIDKWAVEYNQNKEYALIAEKRELAKRMAQIDEILEERRGIQIEKEAEAVINRLR